MGKSGRSRRRMLRWAAASLAVAYPLALGISILALRFVGERWWFTLAVLYLPRLGFAIPLPFVLAAAWRWAPRGFFALQVVSIYLLLVPLMGFSFSSRTPTAPAGRTVRIATCNIGKAGGRLRDAVAQVRQFSPDIVVMQALNPGEGPVLKAAFEGWQLDVNGQFLMASRFPLREVSIPPPLQYAAGTGGAHFVRYTLDTPLGLIDVFNVHTTSPREGLDALRRGGTLSSLLSGRAFDPRAAGFVESNAYRRQRQIAGLAEAARASGNAVVIAGDTNLPGLSRIYSEHLSAFRDSFDEAGRGFGYTFPASHPWMRIDRVLTNSKLRPVDSRVGRAVAAEHLCVFAEVAADR
jgi:vancomycin resistance protein VanJ